MAPGAEDEAAEAAAEGGGRRGRRVDGEARRASARARGSEGDSSLARRPGSSSAARFASTTRGGRCGSPSRRTTTPSAKSALVATGVGDDERRRDASTPVTSARSTTGSARLRAVRPAALRHDDAAVPGRECAGVGQATSRPAPGRACTHRSSCSWAARARAWRRAEVAEVEGVGPIPAEVARRLACDAHVVLSVEARDGSILDQGRARRDPTVAQRIEIARRDKGCRFPGCTFTEFTDVHHIEHWVDGGLTNLDNLVTLCDRHHRPSRAGVAMKGTPTRCCPSPARTGGS